jgi:hypothetical protein
VGPTLWAGCAAVCALFRPMSRSVGQTALQRQRSHVAGRAMPHGSEREPVRNARPVTSHSPRAASGRQRHLPTSAESSRWKQAPVVKDSLLARLRTHGSGQKRSFLTVRFRTAYGVAPVECACRLRRTTWGPDRGIRHGDCSCRRPRPTRLDGVRRRCHHRRPQVEWPPIVHAQILSPTLRAADSSVR